MKSGHTTHDENISFDGEKLKTFFISHLDKIYSAKVHLITHLPELLKQAHFSDLKEAIIQTVDHVENEISRMEIIYAIFDSSYFDHNTNGLTGLVEDAFSAIQEHGSDKELMDLSILFYLQNIESVEMASFQILQIAAVKLENKQVVNLLKENFQEAKSDRTLFLLLASKYITAMS